MLKKGKRRSKMYNKKAISDVVSTVLIILLVVAAVAIIGAIIINTVGKTSQQVDLGVTCQTLDIKPVKCTLATVTGGRTATVSFVRNAGGSDVNVIGVTPLVYDSNGVTQGSSTKYTTATELAKTFTTVTPAAVSGLAATGTLEATVAAEVRSSDGSATKTCDPAPKIACN